MEMTLASIWDLAANQNGIDITQLTTPLSHG